MRDRRRFSAFPRACAQIRGRVIHRESQAYMPEYESRARLQRKTGGAFMSRMTSPDFVIAIVVAAVCLFRGVAGHASRLPVRRRSLFGEDGANGSMMPGEPIAASMLRASRAAS